MHYAGEDTKLLDFYEEHLESDRASSGVMSVWRDRGWGAEYTGPTLREAIKAAMVEDQAKLVPQHYRLTNVHQGLRTAVAKVLEDWNISQEVRDILQTAYYAEAQAEPDVAEGDKDARS
jgi:hypothetical protein